MMSDIAENSHPSEASQHEAFDREWQFESYHYQSRDIWPGQGKHILAQFDDESIVVYSAFKPEIAKHAVQHQKFVGCPDFDIERMTWIKTNFLWMMFRSNWASKPNQEHVLAIWLRLEAFDRYLENARLKGSVRGCAGTVRLQWDPDHLPCGAKYPYRRAIQLGLKGIPTYTGGEDILLIKDVTDFVHQQRSIATRPKETLDKLLVAKERVYFPHSVVAREALQLSPLP